MPTIGRLARKRFGPPATTSAAPSTAGAAPMPGKCPIGTMHACDHDHHAERAAPGRQPERRSCDQATDRQFPEPRRHLEERGIRTTRDPPFAQGERCDGQDRHRLARSREQQQRRPQEVELFLHRQRPQVQQRHFIRRRVPIPAAVELEEHVRDEGQCGRGAARGLPLRDRIEHEPRRRERHRHHQHRRRHDASHAPRIERGQVDRPARAMLGQQQRGDQVTAR